VKNIRVTTNRTIDFHSMKSVADSIIEPGMSGEEKALACFEVVRKNMFQYPWPYDERERREEWHDALKLLRIYGHGLCGVQARVLGALYQELFGYENQRLIGATEKEVGTWKMGEECGAFFFSLMKRGNSLDNHQGHTTIEVFYDDQWHHLDPMVEFYAYTRDGSRIAGIEETFADPTLVTHPSRQIGGLMPDGDIGKVFYASTLPTSWTPGPDYYVVRDTRMDFALKPGQMVRWFWDKPFGFFFWPEASARDFSQPYFADGPRHPDPVKTNWRHYGNGWFSAQEPAVPTPGKLQFDFPYVLVGGNIELIAEGTDLSLELRSQGAEEDESLQLEPGSNRFDLKSRVMGGYGLELNFGGSGKIRDLQLDLCFQHNFFAAPRLLAGDNQVQISGEADFEGEELEVSWEWREANAKIKRDTRRISPPGDYPIEVGELDADPPGNPKYMKSLTVRAVNGG
jgi:hypothetical protein